MDLFDAIAIHDDWMRSHNPPSAHYDAQRVLKLLEESGEAAGAYIGMVGSNPRKGVTHSLDDLLMELADVLFTALGAIHHFTGNLEETKRTVERKAQLLVLRALRPDMPD